MAGFDAEYADDLPDAEIASLASVRGRVLLTRDAELASKTPEAMLIASHGLEGQLRQVFVSYPMRSGTAMTRCTECNGPLKAVDRESVRDVAPVGVLTRHDEFWRCAKCGKAYWKGTHWAGILATLEAASEKGPNG